MLSPLQWRFSALLDWLVASLLHRQSLTRQVWQEKIEMPAAVGPPMGKSPWAAVWMKQDAV